MDRKVVVFDLDDTLYKEIDFLKSGFQKVAELVEKRYGIDAKDAYDYLLKWYHKGDNPFVCLNESFDINNPIEDYLNVYRYHHPNISLSPDVRETLTSLKEQGVHQGIITDGRVVTQRQKIDALGVLEWTDNEDVIINEEKEHFKPNHWSYDRMKVHCYELFPDDNLSFYYVGDNTTKDFKAPNELGWTSICLLNDGNNIHKQDFNLQNVYLPNFKVKLLSEIIALI